MVINKNSNKKKIKSGKSDFRTRNMVLKNTRRKQELSQDGKSHVAHYISKKAKIGKNVKIWHYVYIGDNTHIGNNVMIGSLSHIDYNVKIGNNTRIEGSVYIPPMTVIGRNVFIGPGATFTNDPYPMSPKMIGTVVNDGAIIAARAVIKPGILIGKNSVVGMGSVVTKDVLEETVVIGHPAKVVYSRKEYDKKKSEWESKK